MQAIKTIIIEVIKTIIMEAINIFKLFKKLICLFLKIVMTLFTLCDVLF